MGGGSLAASKKSPFRKTRKLAGSSTPGRASTKYSEGASPGIVRFSPMRADDEGALVEVLKQQIGMEREAERQRQELALCADFNVKEAFVACDRDGNGVITADEFRALLGEFQVFVSEKELALLVERYDRHKQLGVSFSAFVEELTPKL